MNLYHPIGYYRRLMAYLIYLFLRFLMPVLAILNGCQRRVSGTCTIIAPPKKMRAILDAIGFLKTLDPEMFRRLTVERRYVFYYNPERFLRCKEIFSITDNFIARGKEGIVTCFVQSILEFKLMRFPIEKTFAEKKELALKARSEIQIEVLRWMTEHSLPDELVKQYEKIAENHAAVNGPVPT